MPFVVQNGRGHLPLRLNMRVPCKEASASRAEGYCRVPIRLSTCTRSRSGLKFGVWLGMRRKRRGGAEFAKVLSLVENKKQKEQVLIRCLCFGRWFRIDEEETSSFNSFDLRN